MSNTRVRFAPSPTGFLHLGGARTALFNWLLARASGGRYILRIEDTDRERSTTEFLQAILEDHRWLGLLWDEGPEVGGSAGPYFQSERAGTYAPLLERMLGDGTAYRCYCTPEELESRRSASPDGVREWRYDRRCLELTAGQRSALEAEGRPSAIRFRVPEGTTRFEDLVLGTVEVDNSELDDLVLARSDGTPTYNFVVVVDDLSMGITHVIRGSDHTSNTPKQILIARALGGTPPSFGHLPLVLGPDKQVLSKRRGALAIGAYRRQGYLPEALVNYMALLGWSYDGEKEFFTLEELTERFDISRVSGKAAAFDPEKLLWMNAQWLKRLPVPERTERMLPFLVEAGLVAGDPSGEDRARLEAIVALVDDRAKTLADIVEQAGYFLAHQIAYDEKAVNKVLTKPAAATILGVLYTRLAEAPDFEPGTLEAVVRGYAEETGLGVGKVVEPVRVAVTGGTASPGMFETLSLLGRRTALERIATARDIAVDLQGCDS
jgi:glutamyl-tRNA synthetase